MTTDLIIHRTELARPEDLAKLLEAWRATVGESSRKEYAADLLDFARWHLGADGSAQEAIEALLRAGKVEAETRVLRYLDALRARGLSAATVARRRAALRSCVRHMAGMGLVPWVLDAPQARSARPRSYRDVTGPGLEAIQSMRAAAAAQGGEQGARDVAMVGLLYSLELRRKELVGLDLDDYRAGRVWVIGKGHSDKVGMTVPDEVRADIDAYLMARGHPRGGPLFTSCDASGKVPTASRLTRGGLWQVLQRLARLAGVPLERVSPHRLRHSSITDALDAGEDVRRVQKLSRHSKVDTVLVYDDARRDIAGEVAAGRARALVGRDDGMKPCPLCGGTGKVKRA